MKSSFRISVVISTVLTLGAATPYNFQHNPGYYNEQWRTHSEGRPHFYPTPVHEWPVGNYHQIPEQAPVYPRPDAYPPAQQYPHQANSFTTGGVNYTPQDLSHVPNFKTFFIPRSEHPTKYHLPINRPDSSNVKIIRKNSKDGTFDDEISDIVKDALERARAVSKGMKADQSESNTQAIATAQVQATIAANDDTIANSRWKPKNRDPGQASPTRRPIFKPQKLPANVVHKIPVHYNPAKTTAKATNDRETGDNVEDKVVSIASSGQDYPVPAKHVIPGKPTSSWGKHLPGPIQHKPLSEVLDVIAKQIANRKSKNRVQNDSAAVSSVVSDVAVPVRGFNDAVPIVPDDVLIAQKTANPLPSTDDFKKPNQNSDFANSSVLKVIKVGDDKKSTFAPVTETVPVSGADNTAPAVSDDKLYAQKTANPLPSTEDTNKPVPITIIANSSLLDKKEVGDDKKSTFAPVTEAVPVSGADNTTPTVLDDKIIAPKAANPLPSTDESNKSAPITNVAKSPPSDKKKVGDVINNDDKSSPLTPVEDGRKHSNPLILVSDDDDDDDDNEDHNTKNHASEDTSKQSNDFKTITEEPVLFTTPIDTLFFGISRDSDDKSIEKMSNASKEDELVKYHVAINETENKEIVKMNADGKKEESILDPKNDVQDKPIDKSVVEIDSGKDMVNSEPASKKDSGTDVANSESTEKINSDEDVGNTNTTTKSIKEVKPKKYLTKTEKVTVKTKDKTKENIDLKEVNSEKDLMKTDKGTAENVTDIEKIDPKEVKSEKDDEITKDTYVYIGLNKSKEKIDLKEVISEKDVTDKCTADDVTDLDKTIENIDPKEVKSEKGDEISKDAYADIDLNKTKKKTDPKEVISEKDKTQTDKVTGDTDVTGLDKVKEKIDPKKVKSEKKTDKKIVPEEVVSEIDVIKSDKATEDTDVVTDLYKTDEKIVPVEVVSEIDVIKSDKATEDTDLDKTKDIIDRKELKSQNELKKTDEITPILSKDVETKTLEKQKKTIIESDNKKKEKISKKGTDVVANKKDETNINDSEKTTSIAEENTNADTKEETETVVSVRDDIEIKDDATAVKAKDPEEAIVITVDGVDVTKEDVTEEDSEPLTPISFIFNLISNALKGDGSITKMFEDPRVKAFLKFYFPFYNSNSNNESENKE